MAVHDLCIAICTISSYCCWTGLVTVLAVQATFIMLQFDWTPIPAFVLMVVGLVIGTFGSGSFYTIMLPFALDQMIASALQWYCLGFDIALILVHIL